MSVLETRSADKFRLPDYVRSLDDNAIFRRRICKRCNFRITTIELEVKMLEKSVDATCTRRIADAVKEARNKMLQTTISNLERLIER